jgi:hypothetical protein
MSDPQAERVPLDPAPPSPPRRPIAEWEYRTAYLWHHQVRMRGALHARLLDRARDESRSLDDLAVQILEDAVRGRGV